MTVHLMDRVRDRAFAERIPIAVHFDLTYRSTNAASTAISTTRIMAR